MNQGLGSTIANHYTVIEKLGEGAGGTVFRCRDQRLGNREVAIKVCRGSDPHLIARFVQEARSLCKLNHPNVIAYYEFISEPPLLAFSMELSCGETLDVRLQREPTLTIPERCEILLQMLYGIDALHEAGFLHRDIKPANILIQHDGIVKVIDLGVACAASENTDGSIARDPAQPSARVTQHGDLVGTIEYLSPELLRGEAANRESDIYAAALVAYELITGVFPRSRDIIALLREFDGPGIEPQPPHEIEPRCPPPLSATIIRCLSSPGGRSAAWRELRQVLVTLRNSNGMARTGHLDLRRAAPRDSGTSQVHPGPRLLSSTTDHIGCMRDSGRLYAPAATDALRCHGSQQAQRSIERKLARLGAGPLGLVLLVASAVVMAAFDHLQAPGDPSLRYAQPQGVGAYHWHTPSTSKSKVIRTIEDLHSSAEGDDG